MNLNFSQIRMFSLDLLALETKNIVKGQIWYLGFCTGKVKAFDIFISTFNLINECRLIRIKLQNYSFS